MPVPALVDVVVVSYNSRDRLRACVEALAPVPWVNVIVADNASPDDSLAALASFEGITKLTLPRNGGFAYGCNAGWRAGGAPFVLFLNPDASIDAADVRRLVDVLEADGHVGAVGPLILNSDGSLEHSLRRFPALRSTYAQALFLHRLLPNAPWVDELVRDPLRYELPGRVDWVSGACILCSRDVLEEIGGLDEGYFLYCEDIDLCRRIWNSGREVRFEPSAVCHHEGGASHPRASLLPVLAASRLRYARRHRGRLAATLERGGVALGEATHALVGRGDRATRAGHARAAWVAVSRRAVRDSESAPSPWAEPGPPAGDVRRRRSP